MIINDAVRGRFRLPMVCFMLIAGLVSILAGCSGGGGGGGGGDAEKPPTAVIDEMSPNPADEGQTVSFTGHGSDTDGEITAYRWNSSLSGDLGSNPSFSTKILPPGTHTISFLVCDDDGDWSDPITRVLTVHAPVPNNPPTAVIDGISPNPADEGQTVSFTGHGSDTDGEISAYNWNSGLSGDLGSNPSFSTKTLPPGTHTISFLVCDDDGAWSDPITRVLTVHAPVPNNPPTAVIEGISPNPADEAQTVSFTGHGSDTDGEITAYSWNSSLSGDLGGNPSFSTKTLPPGTHTISFRVCDEDGAWSDPITRVLTVNAPVPNNPPTAVIDGISPNPADEGQTVSFTGHGSDTDGEITAYSWNSSLSGDLGGNPSFSTKTLPPGTHTISFLVCDDDGVWSVAAAGDLTVNPVTSSGEQIYLCPGYGTEKNDARELAENWLQNFGAHQEEGRWKYTSPDGREFLIYIVQDIDGMRQALMTSGAHVVFWGHANFGLGAVFSTSVESRSGVIDNIYTIDDPRIFNLSSKWISVNISRLMTHQAYPNWRPVFQDGTSGIMPYDFGDPAGDPPYNYYITYQIPGDETHTHLLQSSNVGAIQRFPDSGRPAWYSADGSTPDPSNPDHLQYFITHPPTWSPSLQITGGWLSSSALNGFFGDDYLYLPAGNGQNEVQYLFKVPEAGQYRIWAWWPAASNNTAGAKYTINHADGSSSLFVDQRADGGQWNELGEYYFQDGVCSVIISDQASSGRVVADGIRVVASKNPPVVIQADFNAVRRFGPAPVYIPFESASTGDITSYEWDFGDGYTDSTRTLVTHIYNSPGTYTVKFTVNGPGGTSTKTRTDYIIVGNDTVPLSAEFSANAQEGEVPLAAEFSDLSSGQIVAWAWDFDDDGIIDSTDQNPSHTYPEPGNYSVTLTVTDAGGYNTTERKTNFILARLFDKSLDNFEYPKKHYRSKTILFRKELEIPKAELRYKRLFYEACNSGVYFLDTFNHGIVFYTVNDSSALGYTIYLKNYLDGKSDREIWEELQKREAVYDYYNFNKPPSLQ